MTHTPSALAMRDFVVTSRTDKASRLAFIDAAFARFPDRLADASDSIRRELDALFVRTFHLPGGIGPGTPFNALTKGTATGKRLPNGASAFDIRKGLVLAKRNATAAWKRQMARIAEEESLALYADEADTAGDGLIDSP